ncbi:polysaccharide export related protein [Devosia pacifica]|uniref:Polysaccharide export related protein n=1 Tax=Devosia pacifica TaxID=1335967 RepID=A0A918S5I6_9HYPH|nr:oligosaccharide flippase family protein [Devosia pacifica]GHA24225.1 polysaccharide export related protein [Devosia pacifica]
MLKISDDLSSLMKAGLSRSVTSLLIKVATAGLTYLALIVLSQTLAPLEYGHYAIGLSAATLLAVLAGLGQQSAILRLWPELSQTGAGGSAHAVLRAGATLSLIGALVLGALLASGALVFSGASGSGITGVGYLLAAAVLVLPLTLSDYFSSALRAQDSVWVALAPRDLAWRAALPAVFLALFMIGAPVGGTAALLICAALLVICLAVQVAWAKRRGYALAFARRSALKPYIETHGLRSRWFLLAAAVDAISLNADTLLVGWLADEASAALYFNAFRTAGLMTLFSYSATLVVAPMLSRHYHARDLRKTQATAVLSAALGFGFSLVCLMTFVLFGGPILSLFGPEYVDGLPILIILSIGFLVDASTGSVRTTMLVAGREQLYVGIMTAAVLGCVLLQVLLIPSLGVWGAAIASSAARIASQIVLGIACARWTGVDTTIFGIFKLRSMM